MHELLKNYPVVVECVVDWGHMDALRHVNNTVYFRYFENARVMYGAGIGILDRFVDEGVGPILAATECRFIRPMSFPDTALCGARALSIAGSEMKMKYKIVSQKQNTVAAVGTSLGVYYDYRNKKRVDYPEDLIARIDALEGHTVPRGNDSD